MANESILNKIEKAFLTKKAGLTIQQLIDITGLARGTVKTYLDELTAIGRVHEEEYGQNTKVYFLNGIGEFQRQVSMKNNHILYVDVMTDPWKKPFVRVKYRNNGKDVGAIFLSDEHAVEELITVLRSVEPQLKKYRELLQKIETPA